MTPLIRSRTKKVSFFSIVARISNLLFLCPGNKDRGNYSALMFAFPLFSVIGLSILILLLFLLLIVGVGCGGGVPYFF